VTSAGTESADLPRRSKWWHPEWLISTWLGVGYLRPGPGTYASATAVLLWLWNWNGSRPKLLTDGWFILLSIACTTVGVVTSSIVARQSGQRDPNFIVIDEVAGQWIALIAIPVRWQYALASFILFRGFDIFKPAPLRLLEKLPGGWGIMLDDVGAGLYALALMQLWIHLAPLR